jgi:hypothetical protein
MGVASAAGAEALLKASRRVIAIEWSSFYGKFYEKMRS